MEGKVKATLHNGRGAKAATAHNDRRFPVEKSDHIDMARVEQNIYWNYYEGQYTEVEKRDHMSFEDVERKFYDEMFTEGLERQNQIHRKRRQYARCRTIDDLLHDKKAKAEESIYQIGDGEAHIDGKTLLENFLEYKKKFEKRFKNAKIISWALHMDEKTPHIHMVTVYFYEKDGLWKCGQEQALEQMGIEKPKPENKTNRYNNRKVTYTEQCRSMWHETLREHGIDIDDKVKNPSQKHKTTLQWKCEQLEKQVDELEQRAEAAEGRAETAEKEKEALEQEKAVLLNDNEALLKQVDESEKRAKDAEERAETAEKQAAAAEKDKEAIEKERDEAREAYNAEKHRMNQIYRAKRAKLDKVTGEMDKETENISKGLKAIKNAEKLGKNLFGMVFMPAAKYAVMAKDIALRNWKEKNVKERERKADEKMDLAAVAMNERDRYINALEHLQVGGQSMKQIADYYIETGKSPFLPQIVEPIRHIVREQEQDEPEL